MKIISIHREAKWLPLFVSLGLFLFTGCGEKNASSSYERPKYPALNASPPPPLLPDNLFTNKETHASHAAEQARNIVDEGLMAKVLQKEALIDNVRSYSVAVGTNHPFALTEKEIKALEEVEDLIIY